jgi:hypothetical protein
MLLPYLDEADAQEGAILDVGSGSGYREWIVSLPVRREGC